MGLIGEVFLLAGKLLRGFTVLLLKISNLFSETASGKSESGEGAVESSAAKEVI